MAKSSLLVLMGSYNIKLCLLLLCVCFNAELYAQKTDFVDINFSKADSIASLYPNHSLNNLKTLSDKLTINLTTEVEQFRSIYKWVCLNVANDYAYYLKNQRKRKKYFNDPHKLEEWNREFTPKVFNRLIKKRKTVCTGYAALISELCYLAGIEAEIVNGYGKTPTNNEIEAGRPNHSWNAVKLNDKWYLCDATWSAGRIYTDNRGFQFEYFDGYFLTEPVLFSQNHYPIDTEWLLLDAIPSLSTFMKGPVVYRAAIQQGLFPNQAMTFFVSAVVKEPIYLNFKGIYKLPHEMNLEIVDKGQIIQFTKSNKSLAPNTFTVQHEFEKVGNYLLHLKSQGELIASYKVLVN